MKKLLIPALACALFLACNNEKKEEAKSAENTAAETGKAKTPPQSEFADMKYVDIGKKLLADMTAGNIDGWTDAYADNAKYRWSAGDSLDGKAAIIKYWKDRRTNVIDSINFFNQVNLPIKVNTPQAGVDRAGVWLLSWYGVSVKYKNGKKLMFYVHNDHHFDANDKIDESIQYIDRAPINAATAKK